MLTRCHSHTGRLYRVQS